MARNAAALRPIARLGSALLGLALLTACSGELRPEQFVGQWTSSRLATTPLQLHANGEWEIQTRDGAVLQYGLWQLQGRNLVWIVKQGGQLMQDPNAIVSVAEKRFELRERDGSVTVFERLQ